MLKIIILILFFLTAFNQFVYSQQYWQPVASPTNQFLTRITFVDTSYGWCAGDSGTVIRTTNAGQNWTVLNTGINTYIIDIYFINRNDGWILANDFGPSGSTFLKTSDGGDSWHAVPNPDTTAILFTIYFQDQFTGYTAGLIGSIYKTTNAGQNWNKCSVDSSTYFAFPIKKMKFLNSQIGFACGGQFDFAGVVWTTTNGGQNWKAQGVSSEPVFDIKFVNSNKILLVSGDFEFGTAMVTSSNGGLNWAYDTTGCFGVGKAIAFRTPSEVWVPLSFSQRWAVSLDSGKAGSWFCLPAPDTTSVYDAVFLSPTFGWACGCLGYECKGILLKYNTGIIGINGNGTPVPGSFVLYQNYPNPFNPVTNIKYYLPVRSDVKITVYDVTGRIILKSEEINLSTGFHSLTFDGTQFASGVYFYKVEAGEYSSYKKMVLIK